MFNSDQFLKFEKVCIPVVAQNMKITQFYNFDFEKLCDPVKILT